MTEEMAANIFSSNLKNAPLLNYLDKNSKEIEEFALNINRQFNISIEDVVIEFDEIAKKKVYKLRNEALRNISKARFSKNIEKKALAISDTPTSDRSDVKAENFFLSNGKFENTFSVIKCAGQGSFGQVE